MADVTLSITLADGSIYRNTGTINIGVFNNQDNKLSVDLLPRYNKWQQQAGTSGNSGTIRSVSIAGVSYQVPADCDVSFTPAEYKNEMVPQSSGPNLRKMTRQLTSITGLIITATANDVAELKSVAEG